MCKAQTIRNFFPVSALAVLCLTFLIMLFYRGFFDPDEGRYSEIPREMVAGGRWMEMRMLGYYYYEKPPLAYWTVAPAIALLGARDWAVRVPLLINAVLIVGLFHVLIRKHWPKPLGTIALMTAASTAGFIGGLCVLLTDAFLVLWFSLTCACLYWGFKPGTSHGRRLLFLMAASVSGVLGFLTKGAVAIVLPGAIVLVWLLWERRALSLLTPGLPAAAFLFLLLLAPVLWILERHNPGFLHHFIDEEHLARFMGTRRMQLHPEPAWFYAQVITALLLPWTLFVFRTARTIAVKRVLSTAIQPDLPESNDSLTRFLVVWTFVVVIFFSISRGKLMSYILPAVPPMALLLGRWGVAEPAENSRLDSRLWNLGIAGLFITAIAVSGLWIISFFQLLPDDVYRISGVSALALIPMVAAFGTALLTHGFRRFSGLMLFSSGILLTVTLLLSPLAGKDFNVLIHINSSHVYKQLARVLKPEDRVVSFWYYRPALPFYTQRLTILFQEQNELSYGMQLQPERKEGYIEDIGELRNLVKTCPGRVYALVEPKHLESEFLPLSLPHVPAPVPQDPDTIVFELR